MLNDGREKFKACLGLLLAVAVWGGPGVAGWADSAFVLVTDAFPETPTLDGEDFGLTNVTLNYISGQVTLSSNSDGTGNVFVDDAYEITVTRPDGTTATNSIDFSDGCSGAITPRPPQDLTSMFQVGVNRVRTRLFDICGEVRSSSRLYLVFANVGTPTAQASIESKAVSPGPATLDLSVSNVGGGGAQGFRVGPAGRITYDPAVIQVNSVSGLNGFAVTDSNIDNAAGELTVQASRGTGGVTNGAILRLNVTCLANSTPVALTAVDRLDTADGANALVAVQDGSIQCQSLPSVSGRLSVERKTVPPGETTLDLSVSDVGDGGASSLQVGPTGAVTYDPNVMQVNSIQGLNGFNVTDQVINNSSGKLTFTLTRSGGLLNGGVLRLNVTCVAGQTDVVVTQVDAFTASAGNPVEATLVSGSLTCQEAAAVPMASPTGLLALAGLLGLLIFVRLAGGGRRQRPT